MISGLHGLPRYARSDGIRLGSTIKTLCTM